MKREVFANLQCWTHMLRAPIFSQPNSTFLSNQVLQWKMPKHWLQGFRNTWHAHYSNALGSLFQDLDGSDWRTLSTPLRTFRTDRFGRAQPPVREKKHFWPRPKTAARPPAFEKNSLHLHSWRPLTHKSHIECTSPSRSNQYIRSLPLSKWAIDWGFIIKVKLPIKHEINLEVKKYYKTLISIEVIIFATHHWKGPCHSKMELKISDVLLIF